MVYMSEQIGNQKHISIYENKRLFKSKKSEKEDKKAIKGTKSPAQSRQMAYNSLTASTRVVFVYHISLLYNVIIMRAFACEHLFLFYFS